jgi:hypothetical protein
VTVEGGQPSMLAGRRLATLTLLLGGFLRSRRCRWTGVPQPADNLDAAAAVQLTLTADVVGSSWDS